MGGFGEVYRAWDTTLQRQVAVKLLLARGDSANEGWNTLLREARLLARVRHPNVVPVYGVDSHDGRVGFWSDFVSGQTLTKLLDVQGPFGPTEAALTGIEIAKGVSAVDSAGLLHGDIKSENVMREQGGRILLMDFGVTREQTDTGAAFAGTLHYMAPELFNGGRISVRTDIYAIGVLLFYLLTRKFPVDAPGLLALWNITARPAKLKFQRCVVVYSGTHPRAP